MICVRCNKRQAIVFVQRSDGENMKSEGYCLTCARELGIKPVEDMMKQFGIRDEDLEGMEERFQSMMGDGGLDGIMEQFGGMSGFAQQMQDMDSDDEEDDEDDFTPGGSPAFPLMFGMGSDASGNPADMSVGPVSKNPKDKKKDDKKEKGRQGKRKFLDSYCENLTQKAKDGKLDNIIGRDREIYRTIQILSRRQKNNPCLIGEAGVGKTAIAEGIAQHIVNGTVPARLKDKEIYLLDLTALVAGTQFRGQFESRVKGLISEVKAAGNVILFIDEIHNITGAGDSEGAMNAANILKPALSRGEIQVIGATTFAEYRKYIEKDQALERRFQPVKVEEPSIEDTISVMRGIKTYYEKHHYVTVPDCIIEMTVRMSERYITDRFLPDKAIDLLDEACACCSLAHPEITAYVDGEKALAALNAQLEEAEQETEEMDYQHIAELKTQILHQEQEQVKQKELVDKIEVSTDDLAKVIELWTGIPALKIQQSEFTKLTGLGVHLKQHIIGQDEAVDLVAAAIKRSRAGIASRRRPASFIFVGPTGTGKTELVKQLGAELFDTVDPIIRLDMSEFMEKHAVSRMIGSPPGYVGYDEAGQLTEKVRRKPYSVVLFDEIEKAHPDVMNILLQILDEGKVNDAQGRSVNFENTVICMTSNAGSSDKTADVGFNKTVADMNKTKTMRALNEFLRPEFLARVDEVVVFNPLNEDSLKQIAALTLQEYLPQLHSKGINLTWTDEALQAIVKKADGGKFSARDIRRVIRKEVEDKIATLMIDGGITSNLSVVAQDNTISVLAQ